MSIKIENFMESCVEQFLEEILEKYPEICGCEMCRADITAYALNRLPPKYTTTNLGEVYTRSSVLDGQYRADVLSALVKGIESVKKNPRHPTPVK